MRKLKINKKILILFISIVILIFGAYFLMGKRFLLSISTYPQGSQININNKYRSSDTFSKKLTKDTYEVVVSKDGYVSQTFKFELTEDKNLVVSLNPAGVLDKVDVSRFRGVGAYSVAEITKGEQDFLVAIDKRNNYLIKISNNSNSTIYGKPVYSYSFVYPYVALIEMQDMGKIVIVDLSKNNSVSTFDAGIYSQVVSVSISKDAKNIYFLGNYDLKTGYSKLYKSSLNDFSASEIYTTQANVVNSLSDSYVLLLEQADGLDLSKTFLLSLSEFKVKYSSTCNYYKVSPSKKLVAVISSQRISLLDTDSLKTSIKSFSNLVSVDWKNDITLLVVDKSGSDYKIYYLDINTLSLSEPFTQDVVNNLNIQSIVAIDNETLHYVDSSGNLNKISLP